jgi:GTP-binding protein HflX
VAPFRSTLEEAVDADLVLHVVDATHPAADEHLRVGQEVLDGLGVDRDRTLVVRNKIDLLGSPANGVDRDPFRSVAISALTGEGIGKLRAVARRALLTAPGIAILRVPLEEAELVRRAVSMPHQLARRFENGTVELALRADLRYLVEAGLDGYRVTAWRGGGDGGG